MKYIYKLKKRIYCTIVVEADQEHSGEPEIEQEALDKAKEHEEHNPMEVLCDGDEWEVEEMDEEDE